MVERHNGTLIGGHIQPRHRNIYLSFIKSPPEYGTKHMNEAQFSRRYRHTHTYTAHVTGTDNRSSFSQGLL